MMDYRNVKQMEYPEIHIYWKHRKEDASKYKEAYSQMRAGQVEKCSAEMVGIVTISGSRFVIPIVASDDAMEQAQFSLASFCYITDAYLPVIFTDEAYYNQKKNADDYLCTLFHEIGHYYLKHLKKTDSHDEEIKARNLAARNGDVYWIELEADAFACHYVGADAMLRHMDMLKKIAKQKRLSEYNLSEIDMRAAAIQTLKEQGIKL